MKAETILDSLNFLDDEIIIETDRLRKAPRQVRSKRPWLRWGAAAACLLTALWMTSKLWPAARLEPSPAFPDPSSESADSAPEGSTPESSNISDTSPTEDVSESSGLVPEAGLPEFSDPSPEAELPDLPVLTVSDISADDMGFEGLMAFDISELTNANPWTEDVSLTTLPVYRNHQNYEENYYPVDVDWEQMNELLLETAGKLGMDTGSLNIVKESGWSNYLKAEQNGTVITVWSSMEIQIDFEPAVPLPEQYHFTYYSTYEELAQAAEYLLSAYSHLLALDNPRLNISGGDYDIYLRQSYEPEFFEAGSSLEEEIINYNFYPIRLSCDGAGRLMIIRIFRPDLSGKIGDYPVITVQEAAALLESGNYITSVPYSISEMKDVKKVELVYKTGDYETYYMPYYRFYVELSEEEQENGLKTYGCYYVPAVNGRYLEVVPSERGFFN